VSVQPRVLPRGMPGPHAGGLVAGVGLLGALATRAPGLTLAASGAGAVVAATLAWPEFATLALVFCMWLNVPALAVDWYGAPELVGALFPFVLLVPIAQSRRRGEPLVLGGAFALLVALLVVQLLSTLATAHQDVAVERVKQFALEGPIVYLLVINSVRTSATLRRAVWALLGAGTCLALVTIYQQLTGTFERPYGGLGQIDHAYFRGQSDVARLAGPLGDPNYYAQILLPIVPLGLLRIWRERAPGARLAAAGATALVCLAIAFTYSRGAAVAFVAVLLAMGCLRYLRARHLAAIALAVALLVAAVPAYRERVETITAIGGATAQAGELTSTDESTRSRTTEMLAAGLAFADHPLLGVGPGAFPYYYQHYAQKVGIEVRDETQSGPERGELPRREAHDIALGIAADLGIAGLAAFGGVMFLTLRNLVRARRRSLGRRPELVNLADSLLLALVAYLSAALFLTLAFERYLWLLAALAGAAARIAASRSSSRASV
jgi:putative inorganic carbon (hco3(-)) transporter